MSRFIFFIIAGIGLILVKVLPDLTRQVPGTVNDVPIQPGVVRKVSTVRASPSPAEATLKDLVRVASEVPLRELHQATIARLEKSPAFRAEPVRPGVVEGPKYALDRIAAEVAQNGLKNIREYAEYVEATHVTITTVPQSADQFDNVFKRKPSARETNVLLSEADLVDRKFQHISNEEALLKGIGEQNANFVTIVGHNENGSLRLPDGDLIEIELIAEHCSKTGKKCIFLSCNSEKFLSGAEDSAIGIKHKITFKGAHRIAEFLDEKMGTGGVTSYMRVSDDLRKELNTLALAANISDAIASTSLVVVPGAIGGLLVTFSDDKQ